jgi:hypothetical protein
MRSDKARESWSEAANGRRGKRGTREDAGILLAKALPDKARQG